MRGVVQRANGAGRRKPGDGRADELVVQTIQAHASSLLATARRHSLCADDAHDAYQRGLEIFIRRAADLDPDGVVGWLHTVVKHEAMAVRRSRQRLVAAEDIDLDAHESSVAGGEERAVRFELVARAAEALQRLKPQELRALWLKAEGHSYNEIASITGWTYTKVNRCLTEGRRNFLARYAGIERGDECERWAPVISAMVDGEATAVELAELRPHLRQCLGCRATVRELHRSVASVAAVLPVPTGLLIDRSEVHIPRLLTRIYEAIAGGVHERVAGSAVKVQAALDAASAGKVAAVAASAAAVAGGGLTAVEHLGEHSRASARTAGTTHHPTARAHSAQTEVVSARPAVPNPQAPPAASAHGATRGASESDVAASEFGFEGSGSTAASSSSSSASHGSSSAPAASAAATEFGG